MGDSGSRGFDDLGRAGRYAGEAQSRAVGAPLPVGGTQSQFGPEPEDAPRPRGIPPPGRALANSGAGAGQGEGSGLQRAINALRMALPFVHRLLPLLDGNVGTAVSNILSPQPVHQPQQKVDLTTLEDGMAALHEQHRDLRAQVVEQNSSLKRVEDHLEMVREATDRNTLEQQELMEDLKTVGNKVNVFAFVVLALLAASVLLNVLLFLHIRRVLP